jgi:hypothetical protein
MVLIGRKQCADKLEAEKHDREYIESLNATLNSYIPTRTQKGYCIANEEEILERRKRIDLAKTYKNSKVISLKDILYL